MKRSLILAVLLLTGCQDGENTIPLPRTVCTETVIQSNMRVCSNWVVGCPKPLSLAQIPTGTYGKGEPILVCRLKEDNNVSAIPQRQAAPPL